MRSATARKDPELHDGDETPAAGPEELEEEPVEASLEEIEAAEEARADEEEVAVIDAADGLLARGATGREDEMVGSPGEAVSELSLTVVPIRSSEFVCARCHMAKHRAQLVDRRRGICRDCA